MHQHLTTAVGSNHAQRMEQWTNTMLQHLSTVLDSQNVTESEEPSTHAHLSTAVDSVRQNPWSSMAGTVPLGNFERNSGLFVPPAFLLPGMAVISSCGTCEGVQSGGSCARTSSVSEGCAMIDSHTLSRNCSAQLWPRKVVP